MKKNLNPQPFHSKLPMGPPNQWYPQPSPLSKSDTEYQFVSEFSTPLTQSQIQSQIQSQMHKSFLSDAMKNKRVMAIASPNSNLYPNQSVPSPYSPSNHNSVQHSTPSPKLQKSPSPFPSQNIQHPNQHPNQQTQQTQQQQHQQHQHNQHNQLQQQPQQQQPTQSPAQLFPIPQSASSSTFCRHCFKDSNTNLQNKKENLVICCDCKFACNFHFFFLFFLFYIFLC